MLGEAPKQYDLEKDTLELFAVLHLLRSAFKLETWHGCSHQSKRRTETWQQRARLGQKLLHPPTLDVRTTTAKCRKGLRGIASRGWGCLVFMGGLTQRASMMSTMSTDDLEFFQVEIFVGASDVDLPSDATAGRAVIGCNLPGVPTARNLRASKVPCLPKQLC